MYRFRNRDTGDIDYIGETSNLKRRIGEHLRSDRSVSPDTHHEEWQVADGRSSSRTRRAHEMDKIDQHKPRLNKRRGGGGRRAGDEFSATSSRISRSVESRGVQEICRCH